MKHNENNMDQLFKDKLGQDRHFEISEAFTADLEKRLAARGSGKSRKGLWIFSSVVLVALLHFHSFYKHTAEYASLGWQG